jgi:hypothetical protein
MLSTEESIFYIPSTHILSIFYLYSMHIPKNKRKKYIIHRNNLLIISYTTFYNTLHNNLTSNRNSLKRRINNNRNSSISPSIIQLYVHLYAEEKYLENSLKIA